MLHISFGITAIFFSLHLSLAAAWEALQTVWRCAWYPVSLFFPVVPTATAAAMF